MSRKTAMLRPSSGSGISGMVSTAGIRALTIYAVLLAAVVGCTEAEFVPDITLPELMKDKDAKKIFRLSKYKPKAK